MKQFIKVLRHYADFSGRARRSEFWYFALFNSIAAVVAVIIDRLFGWELNIGLNSDGIHYGPCYLILTAAMLLPALAVAVRRLHDLGKSAWWMLIALIPVAGAIWLIVLYCTDGQVEQNVYGANPKSVVKQAFPKRRREKSIAVAFIAGAAALLAVSFTVGIENHWFEDGVPVFFVIKALSAVLMLLFGVFYMPADDAAKTANRQNTAFILLVVAVLVPVIREIYWLIEEQFRYIADINIDVFLLKYLALLSLAFLLLRKSDRKNIRIAAILVTVFTALAILIQILMMYHGHPYASQYEVILQIAFILLAVHYFTGKAAEEADDEAELSTPLPTGSINVNVSSGVLENLSVEDFYKPVDEKLLQQLKDCLVEQKNAMVMVFLLWGTGLVLLLILGGLVGIALMFAFMITAAVISVSKRKKVKEAAARLGVTDGELKQAIEKCKKRKS